LSKKKELRKLSKNELIEIIISEQRARQELEERLKKIEQHLKAYENPHTPSSKKHKKNTKKKDEDNNKKPRFPGKPKGSQGGGIKLPEPDKIEEHKLDVCPISGKKLGQPIGFYTKTVIDLPNKPIQVIKHKIFKYLSPTGKIVYAQVDLPNGIYGKNLQCFTVLLKDLTNSHKKIANLINQMGAESFSDAEVQNISDKFANKLESSQIAIIKQLMSEPYLHMDETSFRKDGMNGYVWGIFSKTHSLLNAATSRAKEIIVNLFGNYNGLVVVDGYAVYNHFKYVQRCWAHLLRMFKDTVKDNEEIMIQYERIKKLYEELTILNTGPPHEEEINKKRWILNDIVTCLIPQINTNSLVTYIQNGGDDWFTALYFEGAPLENNHAERGLRPIVLLRKTIGCYRNEKGKRWIDIVVSVLYSWKLQNLNCFKQLKQFAD
jgi:transposase